MMGQRIFIPGYLLVIVGLFFTACSTEDEPTPAESILVNTAATSTITATPSPLSITTQPTPTIISSANAPLPSPTATPFLSKTPGPTPLELTITSLSALTFLTTEAGLPTHDQYDVPTWVLDPQAVVLLTMTYDETSRQELITLINVTTGESVNFPVIIGGSVDWTEENGEINITFTSSFRTSPYPWSGYVEQIDIASGEVTRTLRPNPLPTRPSPTPLPPYQLQRYESQLGHVVTFSDYNDGTNFILLENNSGTSIPLTDPLGNDNASEIAIAWSANGELVGISWADSLENFDKVGHLVIYNSGGEVVRVFEGTTFGVGWTSAPANMLLYEDYYNGQRLCLAGIDNNTLDCDRLTAWNETGTTQTNRYNWAENGEVILFDYHSLDGLRAGICRLTISSNEIDCLLEQEIEAGTAAALHTVSSDGDKVALHLINNNTVVTTCFYNLEVNQFVESCPLTWQGNPIANSTIYWSPSAAYAYLFTDGMEPSGDAGNQGACFVFWSTAIFTCPLTPDILDHYFIVSVTLSPDERFWAFSYQPYSPQGDDASGRTLGILDIQSGQFRSYGLSFDRTYLWRPALE